MRIDVTEDDIKNGAKGDPFCCPIALAVRRACGLGDEVSAGPCCIRAGHHAGQPRTYDTPPEAVPFMSDFDHGLPVRPFSFTLPYPDGLADTEGRI